MTTHSTTRTLAVFLLSFFFLHAVSAQFKNFVTAKEGKLMDGADELRFISYNIPNLHYIEDDLRFDQPNPWRLPDEFEIRDALTAIKLSGGSVTRMYTLSIRKPNEESQIIRHVEGPGKLNEEAFKTIDKVLQIANEVGVRVIIPFVDNWHWWGGPVEYAAFRGKSKEEFWTDSLLISDFKQTVSFMVNRVNTFTGLQYKDDKAILCWETGNELECPYSWTKEIAAFVQSLDTNHLVMEGTHSQYLSDEVMNDPNIDIVSTHHYVPKAVTIERITKNFAKAKNKKPYILGEFGSVPLNDMREILDSVISSGMSGAMAWSLRFRNRDGGFYYHQKLLYRYPGFSEGQDWDEPAATKLFKEKAFQIAGREIQADPIPAPPKLLPIETPFKISWQGSAGASSYIIERKGEESGEWITLSDSITDTRAYRPLFNDKTVEVGKSYYYRVKAKNSSGVSEPSEAFGPVSADYLMMIDEMENDNNFYGRMGNLRFLKFEDMVRAKEDRNRIAGKDGDYIVYKIPETISSLQVDAFFAKDDAKDLKVLTGENVESFRPLAVTKSVFPNFTNVYKFFLPVRYSAEKIPAAHRFIKIILADDVQLSSVEVKYHQGVFRLAPILADSMVLQQQTKAPLWGTGIAGASVSITPSWVYDPVGGKVITATVSSDGKWMVKLQTPKAGGPYEIKIQHGDSILVLKNILIGEVWLASGQSNMEMPLQGWPPNDTIMNSAAEIASANYPNIRLFTVQRNYSTSPVTSLKGAWQICTPQTVAGFSATAYYFGKTLHKNLNVPVGLINSSWGGTPVESWMSAEALSQFKEFNDYLQKLEEGKEDEKKLSLWLTSFPAVEMFKRSGEKRWSGINFNDEQCSAVSFDDSKWKEMKLPRLWEQTEVGNFDGVVWFRRTVEVPQSWLNKKIILELGPIDDIDMTYVNGVKVGGFETEGFWNANRIYPLPDGVIRSAKIVIAIKVIDNQGGGGIYGREELLKLRLEGTDQSISLAGNWKYLPVAEYRNGTFFVMGAEGGKFNTRPKFAVEPSAYTPATLFNAMIHPMLPLAIRGAIWYQGESNTGRHEQYKKLFPTMINEWRKKFQNENFPFYYVQIAPWRYGAGTHSELLREAQFVTLSTKNTGMAVTIDIGNNNNIHPANKEDVGKRLALWALADTYGKKLVPSGPVFKSGKMEKNSFVLNFDYAGNKLVVKPNHSGNEFTIAGEDSVFKAAQVEVKGKTLRVFHPGIKKPLAVRYAFSDTASATLFNSEGLPASSFRTDSWK